MEQARVLARLARLDRIDALDREGAAPGELLAELRGLLREAERGRVSNAMQRTAMRRTATRR